MIHIYVSIYNVKKLEYFILFLIRQNSRKVVMQAETVAQKVEMHHPSLHNIYSFESKFKC